jgi:predicted phage tail protein
MREVHLYGALGKEFGARHRFDIKDVPEALQALAANFPKFLDKLRGGYFKVVVGKSPRKGIALDERTIITQKLKNHSIHIIPVTKGAKRSGLAKILAGILLIGLALIPGGAALMGTAIPLVGGTIGSVITQIGTGLILTGVASLIAPEKKSDDENKSFTISGPQVTLKEGGIVPIAYGEVITGGTMISGALRVDNRDASNGAGIVLPPIFGGGIGIGGGGSGGGWLPAGDDRP